MSTPTKITVEAKAKVPVAKVWEVWNEPKHITQWNSADPSWHTPSSENNLVVGGKFKHRMEAKDGSFGFDFEGIYNVVNPLKQITYTLGDDRQATTYFEEKDGETHIKTIFDAESINDIEMQRHGWQAILNNFVNYVETH